MSIFLFFFPSSFPFETENFIDIVERQHAAELETSLRAPEQWFKNMRDATTAQVILIRGRSRVAAAPANKLRLTICIHWNGHILAISQSVIHLSAVIYQLRQQISPVLHMDICCAKLFLEQVTC